MKIPQDKQKHLAVGVIISLTIPFIGIYGLLLCLVAGVGKEIYDYISKKGTPEILDAVYTIIPAIIVYLITQII